jgi:hypothetical protein
MFGAGPTGLVYVATLLQELFLTMLDHISSISDRLSCRLAQMLRQNGGCNVVVAAPEGLKMELAKKLGAGDVKKNFTPSPRIF